MLACDFLGSWGCDGSIGSGGGVGLGEELFEEFFEELPVLELFCALGEPLPLALGEPFPLSFPPEISLVSTISELPILAISLLFPV